MSDGPIQIQRDNVDVFPQVPAEMPPWYTAPEPRPARQDWRVALVFCSFAFVVLTVAAALLWYIITNPYPTPAEWFVRAILLTIAAILVYGMAVAVAGLARRTWLVKQPGGLVLTMPQVAALDAQALVSQQLGVQHAYASREFAHLSGSLTLTNSQAKPGDATQNALPAPSPSLVPSEWLPLLNDINGEPHVLISGKTNSGKSTVAEVLLMLRVQRGDDIYIIDPHYQPINKYGEITWCGLPGVGGDSWDSVKAALASVITEYENRKRGANSGDMPKGGFKPLTVIVDEAFETHKTIKKEWEAFQAVMGSGARKYNMFVIALSQSHLIKDIGGSEAQRENFTVLALNEKARDLIDSEARSGVEKTAMLDAIRGQPWVAAMMYRGEVLLLSRDGIKQMRQNTLQASMWQPSITKAVQPNEGRVLATLAALEARGVSRDRAREFLASKGMQFENRLWTRAAELNRVRPSAMAAGDD